MTEGRHPSPSTRCARRSPGAWSSPSSRRPTSTSRGTSRWTPPWTRSPRSTRGAPRRSARRVTALLLKAIASTLTAYPAFNAVWNGETLERVDAINLGVAIDLGDAGLIAPALLDCAAKSVDQLGAELRDLVARAKIGRLRAPEIADGTFTLSNLGGLGVTSFTAIITPPQVAILATGATEPRAVVRDGQVVVRRMMSATPQLGPSGRGRRGCRPRARRTSRSASRPPATGWPPGPSPPGAPDRATTRPSVPPPGGRSDAGRIRARGHHAAAARRCAGLPAAPGGAPTGHRSAAHHGRRPRGRRRPRSPSWPRT